MEKLRPVRTALLLCILILLTGCSAKEDTAPVIQKSKLTVGEQQIADLIGRNVKFYDYQTDTEVSSLDFSIETLKKGQWETLASTSFHQLNKKEGRIAIISSRDSIIFSCQEGQYEVILDPAAFKNSTESWTEKSAPVQLNEKIPLGMLVATDSDSVLFPDVTDYYEPENLAEKGYHDVKVITVTLSDTQKSKLTSETSNDAEERSFP